MADILRLAKAEVALDGNAVHQGNTRSNGQTLQLCQDLKLQIKQFMDMLDGLKKSKDEQKMNSTDRSQYSTSKRDRSRSVDERSSSQNVADSDPRGTLISESRQDKTDAVEHSEGSADFVIGAVQVEVDSARSSSTEGTDHLSSPTGSGPQLDGQFASIDKTDDRQLKCIRGESSFGIWGIPGHQTTAADAEEGVPLERSSQGWSIGQHNILSGRVNNEQCCSDLVLPEPVPSVRERLKAKRQGMKERGRDSPGGGMIARSSWLTQSNLVRFLGVEKSGTHITTANAVPGVSFDCGDDETDSTDSTAASDGKFQPSSPNNPYNASWDNTVSSDLETKPNNSITTSRRVQTVYDDDDTSSALTTISEGEEEEDEDYCNAKEAEQVEEMGNNGRGRASSNPFTRAASSHVVPAKESSSLADTGPCSFIPSSSIDQEAGERSHYRQHLSNGAISERSMFSIATEMSECQERKLLESLVKRLKAENKCHRTDLSTLKGEKEKMLDKLDVLHMQISNLQEEVESYRAEKQHLCQNMAENAIEQNKVSSSLKSENRELSEQVRALEQNIVLLKTEAEGYEEDARRASDEMALLKVGRLAVEQELNDLRRDNERLKVELKSFQLNKDHVALLKNTIYEQGAELDKMQQDMALLNANMNAIVMEKQRMDVKMAEMRNENSHLKVELKKATAEATTFLEGINQGPEESCSGSLDLDEDTGNDDPPELAAEDIGNQDRFVENWEGTWWCGLLMWPGMDEQTEL